MSEAVKGTEITPEELGGIRKCRDSLFLKNRKNLALSLLGCVFKTLSVLGFSAFTQKILDTVSGDQPSPIPYLILFAVGCFLCLLISAALEYFCWTAFRRQALTRYRAYFCRKVLSKDISAFSRENTGAYASAVSNDLNTIRTSYLESLPYLAELVLNFAGTVVLMLAYDVRLALIAFGVSLLPILLSSFRVNQVAECEEQLAEANGGFLSAFTEMLTGFRAVKSMRAEGSVAARLLKVNRKASDTFADREHTEISVAYIASLSGHIARIAFFFISLLLSKNDPAVTVGVIIAFTQLMSNIVQLAVTVPELLANVKAADKLMERHDGMLALSQAEGEDRAVSCGEKVEADSVSVSYGEGQEVLRNLSLSLPAGGCYAILGESGSGKTTLLNLLSGAKRDYTGSVRYDGQDIRNISGERLFELISVIYQETFLFDATIEENITLFRPVDRAVLEDAVKKAGLEELVKEKGLDYACGENGANLSGGEKQRVGIARSILLGAKVLLLDEATSALDIRTGSRLIRTVQQMEGKTRIAVTHDVYPELMDNFDRIIVLRDGQIAGQGKYSELLKTCPALQKLVNKG